MVHSSNYIVALSTKYVNIPVPYYGACDVQGYHTLMAMLPVLSPSPYAILCIEQVSIMVNVVM